MKYRNPDTGEVWDSETGQITPAEASSVAPESQSGGIGRSLALGTRNVLEGMGGLAMLPGDIANTALNMIPGVNLSMPSQMLSRGLDAVMPRAETDTEKLYAAMQRGGGAAMGGMGASGLLANPLTQMASGIAAGGASEAAQQQGVGPMGQMAAGLAGGMAPFPISAGAQVAGQTAKSLMQPLTVKGRDVIAGRVINDLAVDPQAAMLRSEANSGKFVGSPTMGQASQDIGLLGAEKYMKGTNPVEWAIREEEQNLAREALLGKVTGTESVISKIEGLRDSATAKLRNDAFAEQQATGPVDTAAIDATMKGMLEGPNRKRSVVFNAISTVRGKLKDGEDFVTDAETLYGVRKDINDKLKGLSDSPTDRFAARELIQVKDAIDTEISKVAPSWGNYLSEYRRYSGKIDRLEELQRIAAKTETAIPTSQGTSVISRQKWATQVKSRAKELNQLLTPGQLRNVDRISEDLARTASPPELRQPGSDTFSNLSVANVLGNMIGNKKWINNPAVKNALRPIGFLYTLPDRAITERISQAMLDPELARKLMQRATDENLATIGPIFARTAGASAVGAGYGLLENR